MGCICHNVYVCMCVRVYISMHVYACVCVYCVWGASMSISAIVYIGELDMLYLYPSSLASLSKEESGVTTLLMMGAGREGREGGGSP